jgi:hypothetical protein
VSKGNGTDTGDESVRIGGKPIEDLTIRQQVETAAQLQERELKERRTSILKKYPPYKVGGLKAQLGQCEANLIRMRDVARQEEDKIAEMREWIRLCERRDKELKSAGLDPK